MRHSSARLTRLFRIPRLAVRPAPSITHGGHFVDLAAIRVREAEAAARHHGIVADYYDTLPDGRLHEAPAYHSHVMGAKIVSLVHKYDITALASLGSDGFCGHPDHIVTHLGALDAQARLAEIGIYLPLLALRSDGQGQVRISVDSPQHKRRGLGLHRSQMLVDADGMLDPEFLEAHPRYRPLFEHESFDVILPAAIGATATRFDVAA